MNLFNAKTLYSAGLTAVLIAGCGKKDDDTAPAAAAPQQPKPPVTNPTQPQTPQPHPTPGQPTPGTGSNGSGGTVSKNALAVKVTKITKDQKTNKTLVEFGLSSPSAAASTVQFKCKTEQLNSQIGIAEACTSPVALDINSNTNMAFTVFAVDQGISGQNSQAVIGEPYEVVVQQGRVVQGDPVAGAVGGAAAGYIVGSIGVGSVVQQVGDMFTVNIPQGFHMVYRSSTFDTPGFLNFQYINGGKRADAAAPYAYDCNAQNAQFESPESLVMPSGPMNYCNITPQINQNASADPIYNSFRWINQSTMSYNSILISSDTSLLNANVPAPAKAGMAKLYINTFTNGATQNSIYQFSNELNNTVSRLAAACVNQVPVYIGTAPIFQGFFAGSVAATPLFGCVVPRNNRWYAEIAAYPIDNVGQVLPSAGWTPWIGQGFKNKSAAEILVEIGPFDAAPVPGMIAADAQALMVQNIKKLLPSQPVGVIAPTAVPGYNGSIVPQGGYNTGVVPQVPGYGNGRAKQPRYNNGTPGVPYAQATTPGYNNGMPQQPGTVPNYNDSMPQPGTMPGYNNGAPTQPGTMPGYNNGAPTQPGTVPGYNNGAPTQPGTMPGYSNGGVPTQPGYPTGPNQGQVYPNQGQPGQPYPNPGTQNPYGTRGGYRR